MRWFDGGGLLPAMELAPRIYYFGGRYARTAVVAFCVTVRRYNGERFLLQKVQTGSFGAQAWYGGFVGITFGARFGDLLRSHLLQVSRSVSDYQQ